MLKMLASVRMSLPADEMEQLIVADFLIHELGHNLGLRHNFVATADREHHPEGTAGSSVMDYVVGLPTPATYDRDAMRYAYGDGALDDTYLYCTDEDMALDPGCVQWDFGDPIRFALKDLERVFEDYPPGADTSDIEEAWEYQELRDIWSRLRQFVNSDYELYDPQAPMNTYQEMMDMAVCPEETCGIHLYFRQQFALYTLYSKQSLYNEWYDYPVPTTAQSTLLMDTYFQLVTNPDKPLDLKVTIIEKLPSSAIEGAEDLLQSLIAHFEARDTPSDDETYLLGVAQNAE